MIHLFGPYGNNLGVFQGVDELCTYINTIENEKFTNPELSSEDVWNFSLFTNKRLSLVAPEILEQSFSKIGREAFEQELDLIEITKGHYESLIQIPVTPDINLDDLKRKWCQDYCEAHGYTLVDSENTLEGLYGPMSIEMDQDMPILDDSVGILGSRRGGIFDPVLTPRVGSLEGKTGDEKTASNRQPKTNGIIENGYNIAANNCQV